MFSFNRDFSVVRGRRSSPGGSDRGYDGSRMLSSSPLRKRRSFSLSRLDEHSSLSRGRSLAVPGSSDRGRGRSLDDRYDRDAEYNFPSSLRDELGDYLDREPGRLLPTSKLTRGGVPLYPAPVLGRTQSPLYGLTRSSSTRSSVAPTKATSSTSQIRSYSYERKRPVSPPRLGNSPSSISSGSDKNGAYTPRRSSTDRSPSPSTYRKTATSRAKDRDTSPVSRPYDARDLELASLYHNRSNRPASTIVETPRVRYSPPVRNRHSLASPEIVEMSRKHLAVPTASRPSETPRASRSNRRVFNDLANEQRPASRSPTPKKKVRFADEESELDLDPENYALVKKKPETKVAVSFVDIQPKTAPRTHKRPEPKGTRSHGDPVLRRRKLQDKSGWSRPEIVWTNSNRALRV